MLPIKKKKKPDYLGVTANTGANDGKDFVGAKTMGSSPMVSANTSSMGGKQLTANTAPMDFSSKTKAVATLRSAKKGVKQSQMAMEPKGKVTDPKGFMINRGGDEYEKTDSKREEYLEKLRKRK